VLETLQKKPCWILAMVTLKRRWFGGGTQYSVSMKASSVAEVIIPIGIIVPDDITAATGVLERTPS
jgi:hypothetical protein